MQSTTCCSNHNVRFKLTTYQLPTGHWLSETTLDLGSGPMRIVGQRSIDEASAMASATRSVCARLYEERYPVRIGQGEHQILLC